MPSTGEAQGQSSTKCSEWLTTTSGSSSTSAVSNSPVVNGDSKTASTSRMLSTNQTTVQTPSVPFITPEEQRGYPKVNICLNVSLTHVFIALKKLLVCVAYNKTLFFCFSIFCYIGLSLLLFFECAWSTIYVQKLLSLITK